MTKVFHFDKNNNVVESEWPGKVLGKTEHSEPSHHGYWATLGGMYSTDAAFLKSWRLNVERERFKESQMDLLKSLQEGLQRWLVLERKLTGHQHPE